MQISKLEIHSLIELVVLPHLDYIPFIVDVLNIQPTLVVFDTQGNIFSKFNSVSKTNNLFCNKQTQEIKYFFINSTIELFDKLTMLKGLENYTLLIDSVTFVMDQSPGLIKSFVKMLWTLIYENQVTVIAINHYRLGKIGTKYKLVPRLGVLWERAISYRIHFYYTDNRIEYKISKMQLFELF